MSASTSDAIQTDKFLLAKLLALLLSIPLMRMDLPFLPARFSDYGWGMMARLGVCFAPVVLIWSWGFRRQLFHWRSAIFLVASVISASAAYWAQLFVPDHFGVLAVVVTGAILLSLAHKFILECSWAQMLIASITAPSFFYLVTFGSRLLPGVQRSVAEYWPYFWQVGYLLGMFVISELFQKTPAHR